MSETSPTELDSADTLVRQGRHREAVVALREYLRAHPADLRAHYLLGLAAYRDGDDVTAEVGFRTARALAPTDGRVAYSLGITLARRGQVEEACHHLNAALELDPSLHQAKTRLAELSRTPHDAPATGRASQPPPIPQGNASRRELAHQLDQGEVASRSGPGELVRSGHRRLSSFGLSLSAAAALAAAGMTLGANVSAAESSSIAGRADNPSWPTWLDRVPGALSLTFIIAAALILIWVLLSSSLTRYKIYERRLDLSKGVLWSRRDSVWLYEVTDVQFIQPPWLMLTGNAEIRVSTERTQVVRIIGLGTRRQQLWLWQELRDAALTERRAMRRWWV